MLVEPPAQLKVFRNKRRGSVAVSHRAKVSCRLHQFGMVQRPLAVAGVIAILGSLFLTDQVIGQTAAGGSTCSFHTGKWTGELWVPLGKNCHMEDLVQELTSEQDSDRNVTVLLLGDSVDRFLVHYLCGEPDRATPNSHQARTAPGWLLLRALYMATRWITPHASALI